MEIFALINTILLLAGAVHVYLFKREFDKFKLTVDRLKSGDVNRLIDLEIKNAARIKRLADHLGLFGDVPSDGGSGVSPLYSRDHARSW